MSVSKYGDGSTPILDDLERHVGEEGTLDGSNPDASDSQKTTYDIASSAFDANNDGELTGAERTAAEKWLSKGDGNGDQQVDGWEAMILNGNEGDMDKYDIYGYFGGEDAYNEAANQNADGSSKSGGNGGSSGSSGTGGSNYNYNIDMDQAIQDCIDLMEKYGVDTSFLDYLPKQYQP